jgi:rare lipoprotein A
MPVIKFAAGIFFIAVAFGCVSSRYYDMYDDIDIPNLDGLWKQTGLASWYGEEFNGRKTANGETYDMNAYTAAHRTLAFGTIVLVRNLENGREVKVRINDRGPFMQGRVIDLSYAAAERIAMLETGITEVTIFVLTRKD